eukprot:1875263-Amphidinium_carterae.1
MSWEGANVTTNCGTLPGRLYPGGPGGRSTTIGIGFSYIIFQLSSGPTSLCASHLELLFGSAFQQLPWLCKEGFLNDEALPEAIAAKRVTI